MSSAIISEYGQSIVTLLIGQQLSLYSKGTANVYKHTDYAQQPSDDVLIASTNDSEIIVGPFASITILKIDGGPYGASYDIGQFPTTIDKRRWGVQPEPDTTNGVGTFSVTPDRLKTGISVNFTNGGANNLIIPTADALNLSDLNLKINDSWDLSFICVGTGTLTIVSNTGISIIGNPTVSSGTSGIFRFRKTTNTSYIVYRIA